MAMDALGMGYGLRLYSEALAVRTVRCDRCGADFPTKGKNTRYCPPCRIVVRDQIAQRSVAQRRARAKAARAGR